MATKETLKPEAEKEPIPVTVVPPDGRTEAEKASEAESLKPENVENREKSYLPPVEGVNMNTEE